MQYLDSSFPAQVANVVGAMARLDKRDGVALLILARLARRFLRRDLFRQDSLAVLVNGFAKLGFTSPTLQAATEDGVALCFF